MKQNFMKRHRAVQTVGSTAPYSGKFVVRVDPELHKTISIEAKKTGKSLNAWISDKLSKVIYENTQRSN